nr:anti-sigma regulatory factor [Candidatus Njordarchaeota archaeon]
MSVSMTTVEITSEADIVVARVKAKAIAEAIGFNYMDQTRIATAVSELARNAFQYAGKGTVTITPVDSQEKRGIKIVVEDHGPGIKDIELALKGGYSTSRGLGMGLLGSKKLMDEFDIKTKVGEGTTVTIRKWV